MNYERPHIGYPFGRGADGKLVCVEQDTIEHVMSCNLAILNCPQGARDDRPEFGWPWPELVNAPIDLTALRQALEQFEPRNETLDMRQYLDAATAAVRVTVGTGIRTDDASD